MVRVNSLTKFGLVLSGLVSFIVFLCSSCNNNTDGKEDLVLMLDRFKESTIVFPEDMIIVQSGEQFPFSSERIPHLVFYYDSTNCASCEMHHIGGLYAFFTDERYGKDYDIIALFSPLKTDLNSIMNETMYVPHDFPMYIDVNGSFARANMMIPKDSRFHVFLLDQDNHPVYIGNPRADKKLERLFWNHINKLNRR